MNENDAISTIIVVTTSVLLFFIITTCYWHNRFKYATELYCQSKYGDNVLKYEQCKRKDLIQLLQMEKK